MEKEKPIRVPGGWQLPSERKRIKELFARLKKVGCFKEFATYEDWEEKKYDKGFASVQKNSRGDSSGLPRNPQFR